MVPKLAMLQWGASDPEAPEEEVVEADAALEKYKAALTASYHWFTSMTLVGSWDCSMYFMPPGICWLSQFESEMHMFTNNFQCSFNRKWSSTNLNHLSLLLLEVGGYGTAKQEAMPARYALIRAWTKWNFQLTQLLGSISTNENPFFFCDGFYNGFLVFLGFLLVFKPSNPGHWSSRIWQVHIFFLAPFDSSYNPPELGNRLDSFSFFAVPGWNSKSESGGIPDPGTSQLRVENHGGPYTNGGFSVLQIWTSD